MTARSSRKPREERTDRNFRSRGIHPVRPTPERDAYRPEAQGEVGAAEARREVEERGRGPGEEGEEERRRGAEEDGLSQRVATETGAASDPSGDEPVSPIGKEEQGEEEGERGEGEGELEGEQEGEEARRPVALPRVPTVSAEERARHELTHMPFRAWCPHCVRGRGRNRPHLKKKEKEGNEDEKVPKVAMDYFFASEADQKASLNPILVMVDEATGENMLEW